MTTCYGEQKLCKASHIQTCIQSAALAIGIGTWCQILAYEKGGKFNPVMGLIIPLLGIASVGRLVTVFTDTTGSFDVFALLAGAFAAVYGMLIFYGGTVMIVNVQVPLVLLLLISNARARFLNVGEGRNQ